MQVITKVLPWELSDENECPENNGFIVERGGQVSFEVAGERMNIQATAGVYYPIQVMRMRSTSTITAGRVLLVTGTRDGADVPEGEALAVA